MAEYVEWKVRKGEGNRESYTEWVGAVRRKKEMATGHKSQHGANG